MRPPVRSSPRPRRRNSPRPELGGQLGEAGLADHLGPCDRQLPLAERGILLHQQVPDDQIEHRVTQKLQLLVVRAGAGPVLVGVRAVRERTFEQLLRGRTGSPEAVRAARSRAHGGHNPIYTGHWCDRTSPTSGQVSRPRADRPGRHGRDLSGQDRRHRRVREDPRAQADLAALRARAALHPLVRRRGAHRGDPQPPQHRPGVRLRQGGRRPVPGHGADRGRGPALGAGRRVRGRRGAAAVGRLLHPGRPGRRRSTTPTARPTARAARSASCTATCRRRT